MADFYSRLLADPRKAIDAASITRVDELGNGYDDFGNLIAPKFEAPQQTWGETALGVATAPARLATALAGSVSPYGPEGWQVPPIIGEGVNALTAVGDAYNYGMSEDEINSRALGMAGFMMGGGGLAARPAVAAERAAAGRYAPPLEDIAYPNAYGTTKGAWKAGGFTDEPLQNPFPGHARPLQDAETGGMLWPYDLTERATQRAGGVRGFPDLYSNASKEGAVPGIAGALDMSPEARLARAREMGFDTDKTWYHGSPQGDLETITPGYDEPGAWFTTDKKNAANYARGDNPGLYETYLKTQNPLKVNFDYDARGDLVPTIGGEPLDILDNIGIVKYAQNRGFDSVHFPDGNFSESGDTMVIFDPSNIRSTNAAFDPSKAGSANLLAANADSKPAMIAGALGQERIDPERIKAAIRNRMRGDK